MTDERKTPWALVGVRLVAGVIVAVACVAAVVLAVAAPWPQLSRNAAYAEITPVAADPTLLCNGPFRALGRDAEHADRIVSAGDPRRVVGGEDVESDDLEMPDLDDDGAAVQLTAPAGTSAFSAVESVRVDDDDLKGLAAAPCREPRLHSWLVGGSARTGASDVILLTNGADVPATVTLSVYGAAEKEDSGVVVPPKTQVAVPLASVAPSEEMPVVEVTAEGAPVRAVMQSSLMNVLEPVGIDIQDSVTELDQRQFFTGVQVMQGAKAVVRVLSPEGGTAKVTVREEGEAEPEGEYEVEVEAGLPTELALAPDSGVYDIDVSSEQPLVAAVQQERTTADGSDFAWMTPAPVLEDDVAFAVPGESGARLRLHNDADEATAVTLRTGENEKRVEVPADGTVSVPVAGGSTPILSPEAPVRAALTLTGGGRSPGIAGWPIWPSSAKPADVTVYP